MNIGRGLGKFAEGLANGYATGMKNRREQEVHDAQMKRVRDDADMTAEIRKVSEAKVAPAEGFVVVGEDGSKTVFNDAAMAHDAAAVAPGARVEKKILVAGKQYDHPDEANAAAEALNSPLAKTRMAANIALKYNRPDVYDAHMKAYKTGIDANKADMIASFNEAKMSGDYEGALKVYNERLPNGATAKLVPAENGAMNLEVTRGGKVVNVKPFAKAEDFWNAATEMVNTTPENALEIFKHKDQMAVQGRKLGLDERGVTSQEKLAAASIAKTEAEVGQMPEEMKLKGRQVAAQETSAGAAATSAGAAVTNADTNATEMAKPKPFSFMKSDGTMGYAATTTPYNAATKQYGLKILPAEGAEPMMPMPRGAPASGILGGLGLGGPAKTEAQRIAELQAALPARNIAPPAPRAIGGGIATTFKK